MEISKEDRVYFSIAIDKLHEMYEMSKTFIEHNGIMYQPTEKIIENIITNFKGWLISEEGASWLNTMGYVKYEGVASSISGLCPICSGSYIKGSHDICELCGIHICEPCSVIVDPFYDIRWCSECATHLSITNLNY